MQSCHENWKWGLKQIQGYKFYHPVCLSENLYSEKERDKRKEGGRKGGRKGGREGGMEEGRKGGRKGERHDITNNL